MALSRAFGRSHRKRASPPRNTAANATAKDGEDIGEDRLKVSERREFFASEGQCPGTLLLARPGYLRPRIIDQQSLAVELIAMEPETIPVKYYGSRFAPSSGPAKVTV